MAVPAPLPSSATALLPRVRAGDVRALARALTWVERGGARGQALLAGLHAGTGRAERIGVTGPPGAGKSTLTAALTRLLREEGKTVGIVCVDPTSPFSGGALLGDRIRMHAVAPDPGVFIRSMATRGSLGGVAWRTDDVCDVLDASGRDVVLIETVGVGQSEVDVARSADTTVVVLSPESGDAVQAMKAGLMEVADVFCVNKADRPGADRMARAIGAMLDLSERGRVAATGRARWRPPVEKTEARTGEGVVSLRSAIARHRAFLEEEGLLAARRVERAKQALLSRLRVGLWELWRGQPGAGAALEGAVARVASGEVSPADASRELLGLLSVTGPDAA